MKDSYYDERARHVVAMFERLVGDGYNIDAGEGGVASILRSVAADAYDDAAEAMGPNGELLDLGGDLRKKAERLRSL